MPLCGTGEERSLGPGLQSSDMQAEVWMNLSVVRGLRCADEMRLERLGVQCYVVIILSLED
jgi:hypothetical protein